MKHLSIPLSGLVLLSSAALAQSAAGPAKPAPVPSTLSELDANHNGNISEKEARVNLSLSNQFKILDTNEDGVLEKGEFALFLADENDSVRSRSDKAAAAGSRTTPPSPAPTGSTPAPTGSTPAPSGSSDAPSGYTPAPGGSTTPPR